MTINWGEFLVGSFIGACLAILCAALIAIATARPMIKWVIGRFTKRLMEDRYPENIWEMVSALTRTSPRIVVENSMRAARGDVIKRPFGTPRRYLFYDNLVFSPAQLATLPASENAPVDMMITIGPQAKRPLILNIPLLAGAMGYGIGVSEKVKIAIAKGTAAVGTATNSGLGPLLPEERACAAHYILQYHSGYWAKETEILQQADAIEIRLGQGAVAGAGTEISPEDLKGRARELMHAPEDEVLVVPSRFPELVEPKDLKPLVEKLRTITQGIPIGVKMCATGQLEADLEAAIQAGVDFISLDGGNAGTKAGEPILEDDFGLPTIFALSRAVEYLKKRGVKDRITLLTGGGYATPGRCLKALALGADGVYMGTALLWGMAHDQVTKAIPWEPPTQLAFYTGSLKDEFEVEKAARSLENLLRAFAEEMKIAIRALGKTSVRDVNADDLVALDRWTSAVTKVRLVTQPDELVR
ncbi:FMN-binding glutamate synthase family protein [Brevibacillus sedimenti]|jgi:glutamate synthase domain-containing protein 2|uniref:FMN-binding glutamate synthase family protein n=1 Tax=Brevibacillus sedimenti TaxID=2613334 RepID=UPI000E377222|nr:FMN-binding glutamate synthase family protein [Anoxybacillus sediminis]REK68112.1 MAG: FMN-binding glutamate synthase family protein [Brevibacillus sp.]UFJ60909.1 FMN-binding glutamate synthase family protein [Anoxybacillus sediminis]